MHTSVKEFARRGLYTEKAIRRKIESGVWTEGAQYHRAPDGRIILNINAIKKWIYSRCHTTKKK